MTQKGHISRTVRIHCMMSLLLLLGPWAISQAQELPPEIVQYADTVLHNGTVLPMDRDQPPPYRGPGYSPSKWPGHGGRDK